MEREAPPRLACSPARACVLRCAALRRAGCTPFTPSTRTSSCGSTPWSSSSSRVNDAVDMEHHLRLARLALQYQDAAGRYKLCLSHLADAAREAAALLLENSELRVANNDLADSFAMLGGNQASAVALAGPLRGLNLWQMQVQVQVQAVVSPPVLPMPISALGLVGFVDPKVTPPADAGALTEMELVLAELHGACGLSAGSKRLLAALAEAAADELDARRTRRAAFWRKLRVGVLAATVFSVAAIDLVLAATLLCTGHVA